jgi:hypothetical protein
MSKSAPADRLESVSVILPVVNETASLEQTVRIILRDVPRELIRELLIVVCRRTTAASMQTIAELQRRRDAFKVARGSHVIIMASDMETNPNEVQLLIAEEQKNPSGIVTTSRWMRGGSFHGYSKVKLVCNWLFQRLFSLLYLTHLTDMTFGFRILPTKLVQSIQWEEVRHAFNLESVIKPLRLGVPVTEIPSVWHPRVEGESQNPFSRNFEYFRIGLKVRFARRQTLLLPPSERSA